jgi:hypothetical protein
MASIIHRGIRFTSALLPMLPCLAGAAPSAAVATFGVTGTYTQQCEVYPSIFCAPAPYLFGIPQAPSFALDQSYHGQNSSGGITTTADTHLYVNASPDAIHARADTAVTFSQNPIFGLPQDVNFSTAKLVLTTSDVLHFTSDVLAPGTSISYEITEVLDSTVVGACGSAQEPAAWVSFTAQALPILYHTTCGNGADHMSASAIRSSTVGASIAFESGFQLSSGWGYGSGNVQGVASASDAHSVDASNTGAVYITVLTPGVTFSADSGATYQPAAVPEPGALSLWAVGSAVLGASAWRRRRVSRVH